MCKKYTRREVPQRTGSTPVLTANKLKTIMKIKVHLLSQSKPIEYEDVKNAYTKSGLYCVYLKNNQVHKYPLCNVFRIEEDY